jgi:3-isopropylmalate/(R)-2-methylmalate dehydratase small subunit
VANSLRKVIRGRAWIFGDSIDTDVIAPSGDRGDSPEALRQNTMAAFRPEFAKQVKPGDILVAGRNFGCGSHRSSANSILQEVGLGAIVAESVARIFYRISVSIAFATFAAPGITGIVKDGEELEVDYQAGVVRNPATGASVPIKRFPPSVEAIFEADGILPLVAKRLEQEAAAPKG